MRTHIRSAQDQLVSALHQLPSYGILDGDKDNPLIASKSVLELVEPFTIKLDELQLKFITSFDNSELKEQCAKLEAENAELREQIATDERRAADALASLKWAVYALEHGTSVEVHWLKHVAREPYQKALAVIAAGPEGRKG